MRLNLLVMFIVLIGLGSASSVTSVIVNDRVLVEIELTDGGEVILPEEYSLLEIDGAVTSFISKEFVRHDGEWIFALPVVVNGIYDLEVVLPSGFILSDGLVYPKGYEISSDGKSIILRWEGVDEEVVVFYEDTRESYVWIWIGVLVLVLVFFGFLFFRIQKVKFARELERLKKEAIEKKKEIRNKGLTKNLFGEEKRIMEFLIREKSCWMKDLVRGLGMSKVMATRKVRGLVEKGLVSGERMGREMKISLKKKVS